MTKIKKIFCLFLSLLFVVSTITPVMANNDIKVIIDGQQVAFDVPPMLMNGRTMVPMRAIFEALGATVNWDNDTQTVTSKKGSTTIRLRVDNPKMFVDGVETKLDSPPCLISGRTLVPVRAISEAFGTKVDWDGTNNTVYITTSSYSANNSTYNSGVKYQTYPGTNVPTYTSVTGVPLKEVAVTDKGSNIYRYEYTDYGEYQEMIDYMGYLLLNGWTKVYEDTEDANSLMYGYIKGNEGVVVSFVELPYSYEIWVNCSSTVY